MVRKDAKLPADGLWWDEMGCDELWDGMVLDSIPYLSRKAFKVKTRA